MENQIQVRKDIKPQESAQQARALDRRKVSHNGNGELLIEADALFEALANVPQDRKPSENELIMFVDLFEHCVGEEKSLALYSLPRLEGFYRLVKDNPRLQPLARALKNMVVSGELLERVVHYIEDL